MPLPAFRYIAGITRLLTRTQCCSIKARMLSYKTRDYQVVLGQSTILLQDGLQIEELPLVIRRLTHHEFPFGETSFSREVIEVTERDECFKQKLQDCSTVSQIVRLLEIPGEQVTAYTAAYALQRLSKLQESAFGDIKSFIRKAILNELCETVTQGIQSVTTETLISLVRSYLRGSNYEDRYIQKINDEVEKRVGDSVLSFPELYSLVEILSESPKGDQEIVNNILTHIGTRFREIDEKVIANAYRILKYKSSKHKYLLSLLDKQMTKTWWKLQGADIAVIASSLCRENHVCSTTLSNLSKWIFMNIHGITDSQLQSVLSAYIHFRYSNKYFMQALERYVSAKVSLLSRTTVAMVMEYCLQRRFLSTKIFDAVAIDFKDNGEKYQSYEILYALRPFGHFNYLPKNSAALFLKIEDVLTAKSKTFPPAFLVELLATFAYLERFPINFLNKIFAPHFMALIKGIPDRGLHSKSVNFVLQLQAAAILECSFALSNYVEKVSLGVTMSLMEERHFLLHKEIGHILIQLLGSSNVIDTVTPRYTPHLIDFEILVGSNRKPVAEGSGKALKRVAVVGILPEHHVVNCPHLMGAHAMKLRHLKKMTYTVVMVNYEDFSWKCKGTKAKQHYLRALLSEHMDIPPLDDST